MSWPLQALLQARRTRKALPAELRQRLRDAHQRFGNRPGLDEPVALARFVALDLETTGPHMFTDRVISIGAIAVTERTVRHGDAFEAVLQQVQSSHHDNILIHQIGGQAQLAGSDPAEALVRCLEYIGDSRVVAFRAEFDATVFRREVRALLGWRAWPRFIDLASLLPALFPGTDNDSLEEWANHFGLPVTGRHQAIADAYACACLLTIVLDVAGRAGVRTARDLRDVEGAQRWLGKRR